MARPVRFRKAVVALVALGVAGACGPSVQSIYEGNVRFEHCYRLDLEVDAAPTHREACWKEWLGMYTYGQPRDRIEYARRRTQAFHHGDADTPRLNLGTEKKTEARQFYVVMPAPTNVHAPPPPVATRWYAEAGAPSAPPSADQPVAPGDECAAACRDAHAECVGPCTSDAGKPPAHCKTCDSEYKSCMKRCFQ